MINRNSIFSLLSVVLGSALVWLLLGCPVTGIDDADIFLVYARHFAEGHGFVYNIGCEYVEGFTSMLWTLVGSGFFRIFQTLEIPLLVLNLFFGVAATGACLRRTERPGIFLLMLAAAPAWFAWCQISLMETGLWCLIVTLLGLAVIERRETALMLLLPFLLITRPESMLLGAWAIVLVVLREEKGSRFKSAVGPVLVFGLSLLLLIGFRLWYFGYPVPNTYYAKVSPSVFANIRNGLGYLLGFTSSGAAIFLVIALWASQLVRGGKERSAAFWLALFLLPGIGIPVLVGGDHFGGFRFYQPLWPLLCLLAADAWPKLADKVRPSIAKTVLAALVIAGWGQFTLSANLKHEFRIAREGRANGAVLVQMFQDVECWPTVATITAGGNKLSYPGHVHDLMGLNSIEMAHAPGYWDGYKNHTGFNRDIFYRWMPNILLCGDSEEFDSMVLGGLHDDPRFNLFYTKCTLHRNGVKLNAWYSNEFLLELPGIGRPPHP